MFRKNVASQSVWAQMNSRSDGSPLTTGVAVNVASAGAYAAGTGTLTHRGSGLWEYVFAQAETNYGIIAYQFTHSSGVDVGGTIVTTAANPTDATAFGISNLDAAVTTRSSHSAADVWAVGTRTLTSFGTLVADIWAYTTRTLSSFGSLVTDIWGAGTRSLTDKTGFGIGTGGIAAGAFAAGAIDASALAADAVDEILDEQIGDSTITMRQALKVAVAALAGKLSGAGTTTVTIRNVADTTNVVVATVDADGNRSAVTLTV